MRRPRPALAGLLLVALTAGPAVALTPSGTEESSSSAAAPRGDADHREYYFPSSDGVTSLHADVLRPKGLADTVKTPVVLTVSPYTGHIGQAPTDVGDALGSGASSRFFDFLDLTGALGKGYTYAMVDLPGDGGSMGCNDWGGEREQKAVRAAVEWAASQPWSNGKVALLGKSYDAWTGLMGVAQQPKGLAAVVAMEPVYSGYRYIWMNGVRRSNTLATVASFQAGDVRPGRPTDSPQYHANSAPQAWCYGVNIAGAAADDSPTGPYWAERDLGPTADGKRTPVFLMQGFLETNTKPDGAFAYWNALSGEDNRAWFGQFDHVRGWEKNVNPSYPSGDGKRFQTGRSDYVDQLLRFLDEHLKGVEPAVEDPAVEVQDAQGRWRAEESWPPADSRDFVTPLTLGSYNDDGSGTALRPTTTTGLWTVSQPLEHDVWLSGEPVITVGAQSVPNANLAAAVYDVDEQGRARLVSRGVSLLRGVGAKSASFRLYGQDWPVAAGHRLAVRIGAADTSEFQHVATRQNVTLDAASITLPFLTEDRKKFTDTVDASTPRLDAYLAAATTVLPAALLDKAIPFTVPGRLR